MRDPKQDIISFIDASARRFPGASFRYEYDEASSMHIVEVSPEKFLREDEKFASAQYEFVNNFLSIHPFSVVNFITTNDLLKIVNPTYQKAVWSFEEDHVSMIEHLLNLYAIEWNYSYHSAFFNCLDRPIGEFHGNVLIEQVVKAQSKYRQVVTSSTCEPKTAYGVEPSRVPIGESNYAFAA